MVSVDTVNSTKPMVEVSNRSPLFNPRSDALLRKQTLEWFRQRDHRIYISAIINDELQEDLALILGLSPEEIQVMNSAVREASARVRQMQIASATQSVSNDGKKLIVTLPPIGEEGTAPYKSLIATFRNVLGSERYEVFDQVAGDNFDSSFDHFGADLVTYEILLAPVGSLNGTALYKVERTYSSTDHNMHGTSGGVTNAANADFVLKHFLNALPVIKRE